MRQFFSWRIWAAFGALIVLVLLLKLVLPADASEEPVAEGPPQRSVDFVSLVYAAQPSPNFTIREGLVSGSVDLVLDGQRTMHVVEGTLGELDCPNYTEVGRCVVLADLLGEAVVWFALVPIESGFKAELPPIIELVDGGHVLLENGWLVRRAEVIDRQCKQETGSLSEFLDRFGPESTTVVDLVKQQVTIVRCSPDVKSTDDE